MKHQIGLICASIIVATSAANAQSTTVNASAAGVNAPASEISFSPSIFGGVRTYLEGPLTAQGQMSNTVGPFLVPGAEIAFKYPGMKGSIAYAAELSSGKGFGGGKAGNRALSDNFYVDHNPTIKASIGSGSTKFNMLADLKWHVENKAQGENYSEYVLNPEIEQRINPTLALAAGYMMHRVSNFDSVVDNTKALDANIKAAIANTGSATPVQTLHAGVLSARVNVAEGTKLDTYVRAGRTISNKAGTSANSYRFQADLSTALAKKLSLALRYRLNLEDIKGSGNNKIAQRGRVIAAYELTDSVSLDLQNTFEAITRTGAGKAAYWNEQYLGATYKF